jgi:hypothetical protein
LTTFFQLLFKFLFEKKNDKIWAEFASETESEFSNDFFKIVTHNYNGFEIKMEPFIQFITVGSTTYEKDFTRIYTLLNYDEKALFHLTKQGIFENIQKVFGAQDIKINIEEFDKHHLIQGKDETMVRNILLRRDIYKKIMNQNFIRLELVDKIGFFDEPIPENKMMLYYISKGKINKKNELHQNLDFFKEMLNTISQEPKKNY